MGKFLPELTEDLKSWATSQPLFFTASAPSRGRHINVSPKGLASSTLTIFNSKQAAYVDFPGSGSETIAHLYENGRVTLMFCSFEISPRTMRLFCTGRVVEADGSEEWGRWKGRVEEVGGEVREGARAIIVLEIFKVGLSCGFGVPLLKNVVEAQAAKRGAAAAKLSSTSPTGAVEVNEEIEVNECKTDVATYCKDGFVDRPTIANMLVKLTKVPARLAGFQAKYNTTSLDGMPGLRTARRMTGQWILVEDVRAWVRSRLGHPEAMVVGVLLGVLLALLAIGLMDVGRVWQAERGTISLEVGSGLSGGVLWPFER